MGFKIIKVEGTSLRFSDFQGDDYTCQFKVQSNGLLPSTDQLIYFSARKNNEFWSYDPGPFLYPGSAVTIHRGLEFKRRTMFTRPVPYGMHTLTLVAELWDLETDSRTKDILGFNRLVSKVASWSNEKVSTVSGNRLELDMDYDSIWKRDISITIEKY